MIAAFFPGTDSKQIEKALKGMIQYNHLLLAPSKLKRKVISLISQVTGNVSIGVGAISLFFVFGIIVFKMATTEEQEKMSLLRPSVR